MRITHRVASGLLDAVGLMALTAGPLMVVRGLAGRREIRAELSEQRITFPHDGRLLPAEIADRAGHRVETGPDAKDYAQLIKTNLAGITGGRTYAEVTAELHDSPGGDEKLTELRQTAFMGEALRASLLSAYQAWETSKLVTGLGVLCTGLGAAVLGSRTRDGMADGADPGDLDLLDWAALARKHRA